MKSWLALTLPVAVLSTVSCQQLSKAPTAEQEIEVFEFPNPLEIEDPNETGVFPPRPIGYQKASKPVFEEDPDVLRDNEANLLRQIAEETEQVREALGGRYGFITSGRTETEKERKTQVSEPMTTLTFYSYAFNKAIDVLMTGNTVTDIREYPKGYQPPTSFDEIELAKQMILKSEYGGRVVGLEVRGIITESEDDHRHIYLTFRKPDRRKVLQITVDMTADKIVLAEEK